MPTKHVGPGTPHCPDRRLHHLPYERGCVAVSATVTTRTHTRVLARRAAAPLMGSAR